MNSPTANVTPRAALAFDLMVAAFGRRMEQALGETVEKPAPKDRPKPTVHVPRWSRDDLHRFLGIEEGDPNGIEEPMTDEIVARLLRGGGLEQ